MSKVKIFSIYYSKQNLFHGKAIKTDIIEPIQTGKAATGWDLGILSDDTGDNISSKNPYYGELTCWYWVWKNWLPQHPECEYIGFTQYRRMLGINEYRKDEKKIKDNFLLLIYKHSFKKRCYEIKEDDVCSLLKTNDVILPMQWSSRDSKPIKHIEIWHNKINIALIKELLKQEKECDLFNPAMGTRGGYYKCTFIMKRQLFIDYMEWTFSLISRYEKAMKEINPSWTPTQREYAFMTEHLTNYYVAKLQNKGLLTTERVLTEAVFYKPLHLSTTAFKKKYKEYKKNGIDYYSLFE